VLRSQVFRHLKLLNKHPTSAEDAGHESWVFKETLKHFFCFFSGSSYRKIVRQPVTGENGFSTGEGFSYLMPWQERVKPETGHLPGFPHTNTPLILRASDRARFTTHAHW
jgi:hypothetical protein